VTAFIKFLLTEISSFTSQTTDQFKRQFVFFRGLNWLYTSSINETDFTTILKNQQRGWLLAKDLNPMTKSFGIGYEQE
jgi:hypothetical protein